MLPLAASSPWPILLFWGFILLIAKAGRKKAQPPRPMLSSGTDEGGPARVELGGALQRAMEKLKQAEREATADRTRAEARARLTPALKRGPSGPAFAERGLQSATDYDEDAVRLEESRVREEAAAFERIDEPTSSTSPDLPAQLSRAPARRNALARFANGSSRGAIVLSEILGRPKSDR